MEENGWKNDFDFIINCQRKTNIKQVAPKVMPVILMVVRNG